ncbi:MAG: zinc ribbon domain-containing protein [Deltaproteobacteria bacterium]|nr:zinc ribbon domain-containing protein [Deltaproteobacteria bacterium]
MRCPNCGTNNPDLAIVCSRCGFALMAAPMPRPVAAACPRPRGTGGGLSKVGGVGGLLGMVLGGVGLTVGVLAVFAPDLVMGGFMDGLGLRSKVTGSFQASGKLGSWAFAPVQCRSGQRLGFFGVGLLPENVEHVTHEVRVVQMPTGEVNVTVRIPNTDQARIYKTCRILKASLRQTNTSVNDVRGMEGSVEVDCTNDPEGYGFKGRAEFSNCF